MGEAYSAFDPELDRWIALKLLHHTPANDASVARFLREAQAMARLSHPNVVQVYDVGWADDRGFIAMELASMTLLTWLAIGSRSWREILDAYIQAGRGLAAAHAARIVHRDFKPANVLIGSDGRVRVADFGLACGDHERGAPDHASAPAPSRARGELLSVSMTTPGAILGTPAYMSPEQHLHHPVGPASDQFSFCVALFEGLYGVLPFAGTTRAGLADSVFTGRLREPPANTRVPGWVVAVLRRGLSPRPEDRYPDMDALLRALTRDPRHSRRRIVASVVLAGAAALAGFFAAKGQERSIDGAGGVVGAILDRLVAE